MDTYDVVIVGGRVAGSTLASLLGAGRLKVLLLERATFPSDTLSTHVIYGDSFGTPAASCVSNRTPVTRCPSRRRSVTRAPWIAVTPGVSAAFLKRTSSRSTRRMHSE